MFGNYKKKKRTYPFGIVKPEKPLLLLFLIFVMGFPFWMWIAWLYRDKTEMKIVVLDKTVVTAQGNEHKSFNWILTHYKYCKPDRSLYSKREDYFGFYPMRNEKFLLRDFEKYSLLKIDSIATANDMAYYTDTYGVYNNEWYLDKGLLERSKMVYGGTTNKEMRLLKKFKEQKKLILTEFNVIASPTKPSIRKDFESTFGVKWTGWVGRYYDVLDTTKNKELPKWLTNNYMKQHNNQWPFKKSGIVFVREDDHIEVLEDGTHLENDLPYIYTNKENREKYDLPPVQKYPYWFDIMKTSRNNNVVSVYSIKPNAKGDSIMKAYNILKDFPAVIEHYGDDYKFYYFAGDFADNPIGLKLSRFRGIRFFRKYLYNSELKGDREEFFWEYYTPLVTSILKKYKPLN